MFREVVANSRGLQDWEALSLPSWFCFSLPFVDYIGRQAFILKLIQGSRIVSLLVRGSRAQFYHFLSCGSKCLERLGPCSYFPILKAFSMRLRRGQMTTYLAKCPLACWAILHSHDSNQCSFLRTGTVTLSQSKAFSILTILIKCLVLVLQGLFVFLLEPYILFNVCSSKRRLHFRFCLHMLEILPKL